jgi:hypothetical protein
VQRSLPPDLAAAKQALELVQQGKLRETTVLTASIGDPVAQKLVEWALLRHAQSESPFERYAAFIRANPDWPSIPLLRRRAEVRLWQEPRHAASARRFLAGESTSSVGRSSVKQEVRATQDGDERWRERRRLARRLVDLGDAATAYRVVREAAPPVNPYYRAEFHFMPGWIALRFLNDPSAAMEHFARIDETRRIPSFARVLLIGAAALPRPPVISTRCALNTKRLLDIPPPTTVSWRTPGSASAKSQCVRRQNRRPVPLVNWSTLWTCSMRSASVISPCRS